MRERKVRDITPPGGNVFEDIGFEFGEAVNLKLRSTLMIGLIAWIEESELNQSQAAEILKVNRPEISNLKRGKIDLFSIDKLVNMLQRAGKTVSLEVA